LRLARNIARVLFGGCIPLLLLSGSIAWAFNSWSLYEYGFQKYKISQVTGIPPDQLGKAAEDLIHYFNSSGEFADIQLVKDGKQFALFTPEEQIHFRDVKQLVRLDYTFLGSTSVYALIFVLFSLLWKRRHYWRYLAVGLVAGSALTLAIMLVIGIGMMVDFEGLFLAFHMIAFTNQFWSAPGYMLMLFPEGFWSDVAGILAVLTVFSAVVLGAVGALYLKYWGRDGT
jgi:integral membrane protein (TIGR01906 family)